MLLSVYIGPVAIPSLPVMLGIGALGMVLCALSRRELFGLSPIKAVLLMLMLTAVGVAGAYLLFCLETGAWGGVSFYGSVFLIPLVMPLAGYFLGLKAAQTMDVCAPCVAIMIGCLRIGCFLTGCCGGWTMCLGSLCFAWPTQAIDSIADFVIMGWLLQLEEQGRGNGRLYPLFMVVYSIMRFFLEFLRDTAKNTLGMSNGQWFALAAILVGLLWLVFLRRKENKP